MSTGIPEYLSVPRDQLAEGHDVELSFVSDAEELSTEMAREMAAVIREAASRGVGATLIIPVGPVDQFPKLARLINAERLSLAECVLINMDEYLTDDDEWIGLDHPLSFRSYMQRAFYDLLDAELAPPPEQRVFPDPHSPQAIGELIARRGGVDACFGGIGINGHIAFNEPPEPGVVLSTEEFASLPTRVLDITRETRTINANTVGGSIDVVPRRCVTVGMREILASRQLLFYANRPWQAAVVRKALHGEINPACPASLLRNHSHASITMTEEVARPPQIRLR